MKTATDEPLTLTALCLCSALQPIFCSALQPIFAQALPPKTDSARVFSLGEVTILGQRSTDSSQTALSRRIEAFNRLDNDHIIPFP